MATRTITSRQAREAHARHREPVRGAFHAVASGIVPTAGRPTATVRPDGALAVVCHPADGATAAAVAMLLRTVATADRSGALWCEAPDAPDYLRAALAALGVRVRAL